MCALRDRTARPPEYLGCVTAFRTRGSIPCAAMRLSLHEKRRDHFRHAFCLFNCLTNTPLIAVGFSLLKNRVSQIKRDTVFLLFIFIELKKRKRKLSKKSVDYSLISKFLSISSNSDFRAVSVFLNSSARCESVSA